LGAAFDRVDITTLLDCENESGPRGLRAGGHYQSFDSEWGVERMMLPVTKSLAGPLRPNDGGIDDGF
jgi:hypothetical protein